MHRSEAYMVSHARVARLSAHFADCGTQVFEKSTHSGVLAGYDYKGSTVIMDYMPDAWPASLELTAISRDESGLDKLFNDVNELFNVVNTTN